MKKILIILVFCLFSLPLCEAAKNFYKEHMHECFLHADVPLGLEYKKKFEAYVLNVEKTIEILREHHNRVLFFGKPILTNGMENTTLTSLYKSKAEEILEIFWNASKDLPDLLPFIKMFHANFVKIYGQQPKINTSTYPNETTIKKFHYCQDCSAKEYVYGLIRSNPHLNDDILESLTEHLFRKDEVIELLKENLSEILLPGIATLIKKDASMFSKPDKARDEKILEIFWKVSIEHRKMLRFLEKAQNNYIKTYKCRPPLDTIMLDDGSSLASYARTHPLSHQAEVFNKFHPTKPRETIKKRSSVLKWIAVIGTISAVGYFAYRYRIKSKVNQELESNAIKALK